MPIPSPFSHVTRTAVIQAFADMGTPVAYCDGQLVIIGSAILLFATPGTSSAETRLIEPDRLEWRPARNDYHPEEEIPWLPEAAIPRYDHEMKKWLSRTHVLLRGAAGGDQWLYCGTAHLGSYACPYVLPERNAPGSGGPACYSFDAGRLPRHHWLALGGYAGWEMTVEHTTHYLAVGDRTAFLSCFRACGRRK